MADAYLGQCVFTLNQNGTSAIIFKEINLFTLNISSCELHLFYYALCWYYEKMGLCRKTKCIFLKIKAVWYQYQNSHGVVNLNKTSIILSPIYNTYSKLQPVVFLLQSLP